MILAAMGIYLVVGADPVAAVVLAVLTVSFMDFMAASCDA